MEQYHRSLHSWQHADPAPCVDFLKMKSLDITCFKTALDKLVYNIISVHSSDPKLTHLPDANTVVF